MYTKQIKPRITEREYRFIRAFYVSYDKKPKADDLTIEFITMLRHNFTMNYVARWLGVSPAHVYRILKRGKDETKDRKLFYLINNMISQDDYATFVIVCDSDGIEVRS